LVLSLRTLDETIGTAAARAAAQFLFYIGFVNDATRSQEAQVCEWRTTLGSMARALMVLPCPWLRSAAGDASPKRAATCWRRSRASTRGSCRTCCSGWTLWRRTSA